MGDADFMLGVAEIDAEERILSAIQGQVRVVDYVASKEVLWRPKVSSRPKARYSVEELARTGLIEIVALGPEALSRTAEIGRLLHERGQRMDNGDLLSAVFAESRGWPIASQDSRAVKKMKTLFQDLRVVTVEEVFTVLLHRGILSGAEMERWLKINHRWPPRGPG